MRTHVVSISVCLDTEAIQKRPLDEWVTLLNEDLHGVGANPRWTDIYELITLAYIAGGDHSEYVIWQENDVKKGQS